MAETKRQTLVESYFKEHRILILVLLVGIIHGIIYLRLVPPWQHYDEPGHVEYAWLIADRLRIPELGDFDQSMRREMAASMIEFDFFKNLDFRPNLLSQNEPIWIGHSQVFGLPLYYAFVALPLRLIRYSDITFQLYLGRAVSLFLYLITIIAAYGIVREITPEKHPLRWMVPLTLALLPGFVDLMTAVNDDVGATAAFSLFLWAGVRIIQKGFSWLRVAALILTTTACAFTKNTVIIALILAMIPILIRLFGSIRRRYLWSGIIVIGLVLIFATIRTGDSASWHRSTGQPISTSTSKVEAPIGRDAFQLNSTAGIVQLIPISDIRELQGKIVTVGAWIWADKPTQARTPFLKYHGMETTQTVEVNRKPVFHAHSVSLPDNLAQLRLTISPGNIAEQGGEIYYDGIVLVEGDLSQAGIPLAKDVDASRVSWNGTELRNYIRNASSERNWIVIRPAVDRLLDYYVPGTIGLYLSLFQDWRSTAWYYELTLENLHQTFWAKFGWGHVRLLGDYTYTMLALIAFAGLIGAGISIFRQWYDLPLNAYLFIFISGVIIWLFTMLRGLTSIMDILFIPSARYAYPAIIPTTLALNMGWLEITRPLNARIKHGVLVGIFILFWAALDILAIASIMNYYA